MMIGHRFSLTVARSVVLWHCIPSVIIVSTQRSTSCCPLIKRRDAVCLLPTGLSIILQHPTSIPGTYSESGLISSMKTIKYDSPQLFFSHPPWCLQNMIEYLRSSRINNRLHKDMENMHCCTALTDRVHQVVICCECQDTACVPK